MACESQVATGLPRYCSPSSLTSEMTGGDDLLGERHNPGAGEFLELMVEEGFGEGDTAYVDEAVLDVPTDNVLLEDEKASERELMDNGLHVDGDDGIGVISS